MKKMTTTILAIALTLTTGSTVALAANLNDTNGGHGAPWQYALGRGLPHADPTDE
ncbi:hypothetical protein NKI56_29905 [Mesorhizobium sp. M0622]